MAGFLGAPHTQLPRCSLPWLGMLLAACCWLAGVCGVAGIFWKVTLEAVVQGGEEQEGPHESFAGEGSTAHLHPVPQTEPHQLKYSLETPRHQEQCRCL